MTADPALRFWLEWAELSGAACDVATDASFVLLPPKLSEEFGLPEEFSVTSEPEVAREDGALLFAAGHPAILQAADSVLAIGDVGRFTLGRAISTVPSAQDLLSKAREHYFVEHGRLAVVGDVTPSLVPVLRVGALATYQLSLHDRFQERIDTWVDIASKALLPPRISERLSRTEAVAASAAPAVKMPEGVAEAFSEAVAALQDHGAQRATELSAGQDASRVAEHDRTCAYYDALVANLADRQRQAPPDRRATYTERISTTRAERTRRLAEIEERSRPQIDVRPFRLHLILVPGLLVPLDVQRGARRYPFNLRWLLPAGAFVPRRCPTCGASATLVATKQALACRECQPPPTVAKAPVVPSASTAPSVEPQAWKPAVVQLPATELQPRSTRPSVAATKRVPAAATEAFTVSPAKLARIGNKLALGFWQAVAEGDRSVRRLVAPDSPAAALRQFFGSAGLLAAVGVPPGEPLAAVEAETRPVGVQCATTGSIETTRSRYAFTLRWRLEAGRPGCVELLPIAVGPGPYLPPLAYLPPPIRSRMLIPGLQPIIPLEAVPAGILNDVLPVDGLMLAARCLATWSSCVEINPDVDIDADSDAAIVVAALKYEVGRVSGLKQTYCDVASQHTVDEAALRRQVAKIRPKIVTRW